MSNRHPNNSKSIGRSAACWVKCEKPSVNAVSLKEEENMIIIGKIYGADVKMLLDTGGELNLMSKGCYENLPVRLKLDPAAYGKSGRWVGGRECQIKQ